MNGLYSGARVLILGLGETGLSIARWIARQGGMVRAADTRAAPPAADRLRASLPEAEIVAGAFGEHLLAGVDLVAVSPGVPLAEPVVRAARSRGLDVAGDVELLARFLAVAPPAKVIAITGTNGKSTVTALAGVLCRAGGLDAEVAGNISPAVLDALMARLDAGRLPEAWVLELSSFQLEATASLRPAAATMLNLSEDHLDRYPGIEEYAAAKARIFAGDGVQVLNRGDPRSLGMRLPGRAVVTFGLDAAREPDHYGILRIAGEPWLARGATPLIAARDLRLAGMHNVANALAALALSRAIGVRCAPVLEALAAFPGLPHRVERVGEIDEAIFYDDSKGTNVGATVAALDGFARQFDGSGRKVVLIAGGEGKGQDFAPLAAAVAAAARAVVLIGRDAPRIAQAIDASGVAVVRAATIGEAVRRAVAAARPGDAVLLSPACASFDMFENYRRRGEAFAAAVRELERAHAQ
jgi:UDP-N-acetylmuramoylalanine--D-glutamate ligase